MYSNLCSGSVYGVEGRLITVEVGYILMDSLKLMSSVFLIQLCESRLSVLELRLKIAVSSSLWSE